MKISPHSPTKFAVKDATAHNHVLKDRFGATFKKGSVYAWLVDMVHLHDVVAEFPLAIVSRQLDIDEEYVEELRWHRNCERAECLVDTLVAAGCVIVDTGTLLKLWGPEEASGSGMAVLAMPDLEGRLNRLREWVLLVGPRMAALQEEVALQESEFIPRGPSATLSDVHWKALK